MFVLKNYSDDNNVLYDKMSNLFMGYNDIDSENTLDPALYTKIAEVKELHIVKRMQDIAESEGIDWYDYWTELEIFEIEE